MIGLSLTSNRTLLHQITKDTFQVRHTTYDIYHTHLFPPLDVSVGALS